jgi:outer membrane protein assembly factor BamB
MSIASNTNLRDTLRLGFSVVSEIWSYKAKDWVTSVHAVDIDNDGDIEIIACSRDGRVHTLTKEGVSRWERIVGSKGWVGTIFGVPPVKGSEIQGRIIAGTRDGRVYVFNQNGRTIGKDGSVYTYDKDGWAIEREREIAAYWLQTGSVIRKVWADPICLPDIIVGSEDGYAYAFDYETSELHWKFPTGGWVRAVFPSDRYEGGEIKILVGSADRHLYVLNSEGECLHKANVQYPVRAIYVTNLDGNVEILVATEGKDLAALTPRLEEKWRYPFDNRLLSLHVADIDNDGQSEIIAGSEDKHIYILDNQGKMLWRHYLGSRVYSVYAIDFDGDGKIEVLAGCEDMKVHAFHVRPIKDLDRKIRYCYYALGKPVLATLLDLSAEERNLLQDVLKEEVRRHQALKDITLKHAEELITAGRYTDALSALLKLEQQKIQLLWRKGKQDKLGYVRSLCFGHVSGSKGEIVLGTDGGDIRVFNANGRSLWSLHVSDRVLTVQTGWIDRGRWEDIVVCSSDHKAHIVSGIEKQEKPCPLNQGVTCIYITGGNRQRPAEIIIGSDEEKLHIYSSDLQTPLNTITIPEGIRLVHAYAQREGDIPEIVAGSKSHCVYAFTRTGKQLWKYEVWDHVQALDIADIDGDGNVEVIVGAEDRNVHIVDSCGHLKWRYFLPHNVLAVRAIDVDQDGKVEILVGCADGYMYVFDRDGDLLWKYRANDRIYVIDACDIDDDGNLEIAVGSEDELELLQMVNQQQIRSLIEQCLAALQQGKSSREVIAELFQSADPAMRAFALHKVAEQLDLAPKDFEIFERFMKDDFVEVRRALINAVGKCYLIDPQRATQILEQLSTDTDHDVRLAFVEQLPLLMKSDWQQGFEYLQRFFRNSDRFVRRAVVRQLYQLVGISQERDRYRAIFHLLLKAAQDGESEWLRQEAARALAHFLSRHQGGLIIYMHFFIVRDLHPKILHMIAHQTTAPVAQHFIDAVIPLLRGLGDTNVLESLEQVVEALEDMKSLKYGNDSWLIYDELRHLFSLHEIDDIARYQCTMDASQFIPGNQLAEINLTIFNRLSSITRYLKIYLKRESVNDRLSSLLEANRAIDEMNRFVKYAYSVSLLGEPITKLVARRLFKLLLKRWREIILAELSELRGKPELQAELQTRYARYEEQVGVLLKVCNMGRGSAENVKVTLLHGNDFDVLGCNSVETEFLFSQQEMPIEFTIRPRADCLDLKFEIIYDDAESLMKRQLFGDRLELQALPMSQEFRYIANPYSTGTPIHDRQMFYGRDRAIDFLKTNLARTTAQSVILLYGQRRSGKTTMLLHLVYAPILEEHIPVLIDMQRESYNISLIKLLCSMAYYIAHAMRKKGITIYSPEQNVFESDPTLAFGVFLDEVETQLNGHKLILLIDEFEVLEEQIKKGRLEPELLEYLRSIMQHHHSINFLLSGTHKLEQLTQANWSVFFNIARQFRLSRLSPQGAEDLIKKPVEGHLEYDSYALEKIRQLTADQPYLIHLICRSLIDHCNDQRKAYVTINDVNTVLPEVMQTCESHFDWLWRELTREEQIILSLIVEEGKDEGRALSLVEIEEGYRYHRIPFKRERLQVCLASLIDADIIEKVSEGVRGHLLDDIRYRIHVGLIQGWLYKNKPLELIAGE